LINLSGGKRAGIIYAILFLFIFAGLTGCSKEAKKEKHWKRGEKYFAENKSKEAIIEYKNFLQIDPKDSNVRYREAFSEFSKCVELNQDQMDARLYLGNFYLL
jgi:hypothetical protein